MGALMDSPLRFGFWGAGAVATQVAADLRLVDRARLHSVASRTLDAARTLAARHAVERSGAGLDVLLGDPDVDVVYISTPPQCHAADAIACLEAGKAVLCEKPFALNAHEAEAVAATARRTGRFCMEAMWTRFVPAVVEATAAVRAGRLGRLALMQGDFAYPVAPDPRSALFDPARGGGALLDRGVYLVSLAQHWLGEPQRVAATAVIGPQGVDEHCSVALAWDAADGSASGASASLAAGLRVRGRNELWLAGERATLRLAAPFYRAHRLEWRETGAPHDSRTAGGTGWRERLRDAPALWKLRRRLGWAESPGAGGLRRFDFAGHGYQFQLMEVARCLHAGLSESATMPLRDSVAVMRTLDRIAACWRHDG